MSDTFYPNTKMEMAVMPPSVRPGTVHELLSLVSQMDEATAVETLVKWRHPSLVAFLRTLPGVDESLTWIVGAGPGQYESARYDDGATIYDVARLIYCWVETPDSTSPMADDLFKRRNHFRQNLSTMVKSEADALAAVSRGENPWLPGLTADVIWTAYPETARPAPTNARQNATVNLTRELTASLAEHSEIAATAAQEIKILMTRVHDWEMRVEQSRRRVEQGQSRLGSGVHSSLSSRQRMVDEGV